MKKAEIKVGGEYAYQSNSYLAKRRVRVLAVGLPLDRSYRGTTHNGVSIEYLSGPRTGVTEIVATRQIVSTWEAAEAANEAAARRQAEREAAQAVAAKRTAERLFEIHDALIRLGVPSTTQTLNDQRYDNAWPGVKAFTEAGFEVGQADAEREFTIDSPLDLHDGSRGRVDLSVVADLARGVA